MYQNKKVGVIIAAAGSGTRMGGGISKQFRNVGGMPVLSRAAAAFDAHPYIDEIVVVTRADSIELCRAEMLAPYGFSKIKGVFEGGKTRQESVYQGLSALSDDTELVLVHDGARPFVDGGTIARTVAAAAEHRAAVAAVPVKDTVKQAGGQSGGADGCRDGAAGTQDHLGVVAATPAREELFAAQTPQGFSVPLLRRAMEQAFSEHFCGTDESVLVERLGEKVYLVMGGYENIKLTTPEDLIFAEAVTKESRTDALPQPRIGTGFDVHRIVSGRRLILGGVEIPWDKGLLGHSDADVLVHAVMDALLGAAALGDIGQHFPDSDDTYRGISSLVLLEKVAGLLAEAGYRVGNVDAVLMAQQPKIAPYIRQMRENMAAALAVSPEQIGLKGTTTEGLGYCGRGEGMAAQAVALLYKK